MTAPTYTDAAKTGEETVSGDVIVVVDEIFVRRGLESPVHELRSASDEADDLVASLTARDRLDGKRGEALSLEESIRAHGLNPSDFGLE